jgi:5'(3')-deoxyribonucleotidase
MKDWETSKLAYIKDHNAKPLKKPQIRLNTLRNIETALNQKFPELLKDPDIFKNLTRATFEDRYFKAKGKPLNSAEKSVIFGLYKFSR